MIGELGRIRTADPLIKAKTKKDFAEKSGNPLVIGELGRIRTADPLIKSQMLYRLSYEPASLKTRNRGIV